MSTYRIADLLVEMHSFGKTQRQAEPYLTQDTSAVDILIQSNWRTLTDGAEALSQDDREYLATGANFYKLLISFGGIFLHSSCVVVDEKAYLFSAPCGTGKSTHTELWLKLFGERAYILNDDKPALRVIDDQVYVYGTPWCGKTGKNRNARVALGGIAFLTRAKENSIVPMPKERAIFSILDQSVHNAITAAEMDQCITTIEKIVNTCKVFQLHCNMDISAARLSYEKMSGRRLML